MEKENVMRRPTYTKSSLVKRMFRPGERSLPRTELLQRLKEALCANEGQTAESILDDVLQLPDAPVQIGRSEAIVELSYKPHQLHDLAYRYVRDSHTPKPLESIMRELRRRTPFAWNVIARVLTLEKDPRFVQFEQDDRWYLAEWKVANDAFYEFAKRERIHLVNLRNLYYTLEREVGLSGKEYVFLPEKDDRFRVEGDHLHVLWNEDLPEEPSAPDVDGPLAKEQLQQVDGEGSMTNEDWKREEQMDLAEFVEVETREPKPEAIPQEPEGWQEPAATSETTDEKQVQMTLEEDCNMNTLAKSAVHQDVKQLLDQAVALLENRNREMAQEVVSHFQEGNLEAIQTLMVEKQNNEQTVDELRQVLTQLGGQ